jgi:GxxExxY protein
MSTLAAVASANEDRYRDPRTSPIIAAAIEVHRYLGPGLLESAYEECLCHELHLTGLSFRRQVPLPVIYKGLPLDCGYQIDLIVRDEVIVELKAIERILPIHQAQLLKACRKGRGFTDHLQRPRTDAGHHQTSQVKLFTTETQRHRATEDLKAKRNRATNIFPILTQGVSRRIRQIATRHMCHGFASFSFLCGSVSLW